MHTDSILIIRPQTVEKLKALKSFLSTFNLDYEVQKPYNEDFVHKIQKSRQEFETGEFKRVQQKDLKSFLGL